MLPQYRSPGRSADSPTLTRDLLARYLAGDFEAEAKLFERYRAALVQKAVRHPRMRAVAREVAAEDVVQEVMWRVLSSRMLGAFEDRGRGSLEAALETVLERTLVDMGRRFGASKRGGDRVKGSLDAPELDGRKRSESLPADQTTPTSNARSNELVELCRRVLEPREREAWELVELRGFDSNEAAVKLGTSGAAIRGLLLRARGKLVRALGERGGGELRS